MCNLETVTKCDGLVGALVTVVACFVAVKGKSFDHAHVNFPLGSVLWICSFCF